ncbi:MAG: DUF2089 domain-containing protein [candidate division FCPU426 bacterium]
MVAKNTWQDLTVLTQQEELVIERVRLVKKGIAIEGSFELPPMAKLPMEDQIFIATFVKTHGSIKQMEQMFGVSYPTIKNRLNRLGRQFDFVHVNAQSDRGEVLAQLEKGEITVDEAVERLKP